MENVVVVEKNANYVIHVTSVLRNDREFISYATFVLEPFPFMLIEKRIYPTSRQIVEEYLKDVGSPVYRTHEVIPIDDLKKSRKRQRQQYQQEKGVATPIELTPEQEEIIEILLTTQ